MINRPSLRIGHRDADDHEPHLAHETPRGFLASLGIAVAIGAAIVAGTLAIFS